MRGHRLDHGGERLTHSTRSLLRAPPRALCRASRSRLKASKLANAQAQRQQIARDA